ncbi:MAG TPA: hypothetical protein VFR78_11560 [Pyrinomonadaceae bacterium]|nr:hypothetical protein [Pyrinomonadaceae bacterium]
MPGKVLCQGTAGLWSVKYRGGVTVVQDLRDALRCAVEQSTLTMDLIEHSRRTNDQDTIGPWELELRNPGRRMQLIQQVLNYESE